MLFKSIDVIYNSLKSSLSLNGIDEIISISKSAVQFSLVDGHTENNDVGQTKIGGVPDVPDNFSWPCCDKIDDPSYLPKQTFAAPLWFLGQINLGQLGDPFSCDDGLLSFFAAVQRDDFPSTGGKFDDWKVVFFEKYDDLMPAAPPTIPFQLMEALSGHDYELCANGVTCFESSSVITKTWQSLPDDFHSFVEIMPSISRPAFDVLKNVKIPFSQQPLHLFGGYPQTLNLSLKSITARARYVHPISNDANLSIDEKIYADKIDNKEWSLLAQFDTQENLRMILPGWGRIYFMIRNRDFIDKNFDRVIVVNDHT